MSNSYLHVRHSFAPVLHKHNITYAQFKYLVIICSENSLKMTDIALRTLKTGATITTMVDQLEEKKLVKRERSKKDRRSIYIVATRGGHKLKNTLMKSLDALVNKNH